MHYDSEICQKAYDQLYNDSEKILQLIKVQMDNLTMPSCPLYEEVLDTQMFGLQKEVDFAVQIGRSEERRVGKECRWEWWQYGGKNKKEASVEENEALSERRLELAHH